MYKIDRRGGRGGSKNRSLGNYPPPLLSILYMTTITFNKIIIISFVLF